MEQPRVCPHANVTGRPGAPLRLPRIRDGLLTPGEATARATPPRSRARGRDRSHAGDRIRQGGPPGRVVCTTGIAMARSTGTAGPGGLPPARLCLRGSSSAWSWCSRRSWSSRPWCTEGAGMKHPPGGEARAGVLPGSWSERRLAGVAAGAPGRPRVRAGVPAALVTGRLAAAGPGGLRHLRRGVPEARAELVDLNLVHGPLLALLGLVRPLP